MAPRTYKIELVVDMMTQTQNNTVDGIVKTSARELLAQAMLLADNRQPRMYVTRDDDFSETTEFSLHEEAEDETTPEYAARQAEGARTENAKWAYSAGYTVADGQGGWRYNDPNGHWSERGYESESEAWEAAYTCCLPA
jgi:hypothetical protein